MNDLKKSTIDIEKCPTCENFIPYDNRSAREKIKTNIRYGLGVSRLLGFILSKYGIVKNVQSIEAMRETWIIDGKTCVQKYENLDLVDEDHAIIIVKNKSKSKDINLFAYGSGIDLLVNYFIPKQIKFKIFHCEDGEHFESAIRNTHAQNLWIFGHGARHKVDFGDNFFCYCKLKDAPRRLFIAQLHCSHGEGKALWEYLSYKPGIFSENYRHVLQNREDIQEWISKN